MYQGVHVRVCGDIVVASQELWRVCARAGEARLRQVDGPPGGAQSRRIRGSFQGVQGCCTGTIPVNGCTFGSERPQHPQSRRASSGPPADYTFWDPRSLQLPGLPSAWHSLQQAWHSLPPIYSERPEQPLCHGRVRSAPSCAESACDTSGTITLARGTSFCACARQKASPQERWSVSGPSCGQQPRNGSRQRKDATSAY
jgi:hypothetical protein